MSLLKDLSDDLLGPFEGLNVQSVSGWKQVVVVEDLDEWPNFGPLGNLLLVMLSSNLQWVSLDPAIKACKKLWFLEPSSRGFTMTTFLPA